MKTFYGILHPPQISVPNDVGRHIVTRPIPDRHHHFSMPSSSPAGPFPRPNEDYEFPDPTTMTEKNAFRTKGASKFYDPCGPASENSMKCLDRNNYDKSKCQKAFDAYRECKRMWVAWALKSSTNCR
jgi:cytochrome c oxidase assembly protein subunit 23